MLRSSLTDSPENTLLHQNCEHWVQMRPTRRCNVRSAVLRAQFQPRVDISAGAGGLPHLLQLSNRGEIRFLRFDSLQPANAPNGRNNPVSFR